MTNRFGVVLLCLVLGFATLVAGCGSSSSSGGTKATPTTKADTDKDADKDSDKDKDDDDDGDDDADLKRSACTVKAGSKSTGLPAKFPLPSALTLGDAEKDGPTIMADGFWTADLDAVYTAYQTAFTQAGYVITHKEHDPHDAEINYSGESRVGQIALHDNCTEKEMTRVHIVNRPG